MKTLKTIPAAVAAIIPFAQLKITKRNLREFTGPIIHLEKLLEECPKIGKTDGMKEHPAIFHYFFGGSDFYICEYDPADGQMFGYAILNGDLRNSEWGYFSVQQFTNSIYMNIDYHFEKQSIEAALYEAYPKHFKKPASMCAKEIQP